jgi:hypothetical protein
LDLGKNEILAAFGKGWKNFEGCAAIATSPSALYTSFPRRRTAVQNKIAEPDLAYSSSFPRRRESITRVHLRRTGAKPQGITLSMDSRLRGNDEIAISSPEVAQVKLQAYAYEATSSLGIFIPDSSAPSRERRGVKLRGN